MNNQSKEKNTNLTKIQIPISLFKHFTLHIMSKRNEIKQKEHLQLQLQAQFNKLDQTVLSWLKPTSDSSTASSNTTSTISTEFINQIVIPSGKGVQFYDNDDDDDDSKPNNGVTINEFLDTASKLSSSKGKKNDTNSDKIQKIGDLKKKRDNLYSSNSLRALSNKIRNDKRGRFKNSTDNKNNDDNVRKFASKGQNVSSKFRSKSTTIDTNISDSDSENEDTIILKSKSTAKSKTTSKNKRPF